MNPEESVGNQGEIIDPTLDNLHIRCQDHHQAYLSLCRYASAPVFALEATIIWMMINGLLNGKDTSWITIGLLGAYYGVRAKLIPLLMKTDIRERFPETISMTQILISDESREKVDVILSKFPVIGKIIKELSSSTPNSSESPPPQRYLS